jgi:hypothetical protein
LIEEEKKQAVEVENIMEEANQEVQVDPQINDVSIDYQEMDDLMAAAWDEEEKLGSG